MRRSKRKWLVEEQRMESDEEYHIRITKIWAMRKKMKKVMAKPNASYRPPSH